MLIIIIIIIIIIIFVKAGHLFLCYCCQYQMLLKRSNLKDDTKDEVEATVAILEKLPKPKPPNVKGHFYNNIEQNILSSLLTSK